MHPKSNPGTRLSVAGRAFAALCLGTALLPAIAAPAPAQRGDGRSRPLAPETPARRVPPAPPEDPSRLYEPLTLDKVAAATRPGALVRVSGWIAQYGQSDQLLLFADHSLGSRRIVLDASRLGDTGWEIFRRDCHRLCRVEIWGRVLPRLPGGEPSVDLHALRVLG